MGYFEDASLSAGPLRTTASRSGSSSRCASSYQGTTRCGHHFIALPLALSLSFTVFVPKRTHWMQVLLVDTDYPFSDTVTVLLTNLPQNTPVYLRVPGWATAATATLNDQPWSDGAPPANGSMLLARCPAGPLCNLTLQLNPEIRLEHSFGSSVSVLRGSLLFSAFIGNRFIKYDGCASIGAGRGCGNPPYQPAGARAPAEAAWYGVEPVKPPNLALVIPDPAALARSFKLDAPGLPCWVSPAGSAWPHCSLASPPTCERSCVAPFNHSGFPITITAKARDGAFPCAAHPTSSNSAALLTPLRFHPDALLPRSPHRHRSLTTSPSPPATDAHNCAPATGPHRGQLDLRSPGLYRECCHAALSAMQARP